MNTLILGIIIGAGLVVFCLWCMDGPDVTDAEMEAWQDWMEELRRRAAGKERE